jgi:heat shock protein HtpX
MVNRRLDPGSCGRGRAFLCNNAWLALACLALPILEIMVGFGGVFWALFGAVFGITILWSLVPRRDKFEPPGVPIDLSGQKRLAEELEAIAAALGERMPTEVYFIPDANAFVARRGGWMAPAAAG